MGKVSEWKVEHLEDLGVVVRTACDWRNDEGKPLGLAFEVFEVLVYADPPEFRSAEEFNEYTADLDKAEKLFYGNIKWDGCSHNYFGDKGGYYHGCSRNDVVRMGKVLEFVWERALEVVPELKEFA